jgi:hypothetical protein
MTAGPATARPPAKKRLVLALSMVALVAFGFSSLLDLSTLWAVSVFVVALLIDAVFAEIGRCAG